MEINRRTALTGIVIAATMLSGNSARAARMPRIELLREVSVAGTRVLLSDLLPASAPNSLRKRAGEISLGAAPQPGNTRILERDAVERGAGVNQDVLLKVAVPEHIFISRDARPVTLMEVFAAVRVALRHAGAPAADTLRPEDILLESQVFVSPGDSGLQVMRMEIDRGLRRARFLLWPSHDPKTLPFFVTARLSGELPTGQIRPPVRFDGPVKDVPTSLVPTPVAKQATQQEILVTQGEQATLMLRSEVMRIFVNVVSLEHGTLGQRIRVRMLDNGKIFNAQVDGRAHLEMKF
jgi:hypothetical protein